MKAIRVRQLESGPSLWEDTVPMPTPGENEVLVRVCAAGVTRAELEWHPTFHKKSGEARFGAVPGHEFSGVVSALGRKVEGISPGQAVFGMNDWFQDGAFARYCVAPSTSIVAKPERLSHAEAASVPISALTAWQALFDHAKLKAGERVLVHGGAGAVGVFAIQLARLVGAHTAATASADNLNFVRSLGAEDAIDYRAQRFEDLLRPVDVVLDTIGGETLARSWAVLKTSGRMVTIASSESGREDRRGKAVFFVVEPNHEQLGKVATMLEDGMLQAEVDTIVPWNQATQAILGKIERRHRGKVVITTEGCGECESFPAVPHAGERSETKEQNEKTIGQIRTHYGWHERYWA